MKISPFEINCREDFIKLLEQLASQCEREESENLTTADYLRAAIAWAQDSEFDALKFESPWHAVAMAIGSPVDYEQ
jgi:hypothetical protein